MTQAQSVAIESSQINSSGVLTVPGGGTGLSTVGTSGYFLQSNGTGLQYAAVPATTPAGSNTQIQYNNSGSFGASSLLVWDGTNFGIGTSTPSSYGTLSVISTGNPVIYTGSTTSGSAGGITIQGAGSGSYPSLNLQQNTTNYWSVQLRGDTNLHLYRQAGSGYLLVDSGDVGIGTAPYYSHKLCVNGNAVFAGISLNISVGAYETTLSTDGGTTSTSNSFILNNSGGGNMLNVQYGGNLQFNSGYGSAATAYGCRAWASIGTSGTTLNGSGGVSSVSRNATGQFSLTLAFTMPDTNYATVGTASNAGGTIDNVVTMDCWGSTAKAKSTTVFYWTVDSPTIGGQNPTTMYFAVFR